MDHPSEQLTIPETAARLGVSIVTVRRRLKAGHLNGVKIETPQGYEWRVCLEAASEDRSPTEPTPPSTSPSGEIAALRGTIEVLERELAGRNQEVERLTSLLSREQEIVRAMQLALPASTPQPTTQEQALTARRVPDDQIPGGWWSRMISRLRTA